MPSLEILSVKKNDWKCSNCIVLTVYALAIHASFFFDCYEKLMCAKSKSFDSLQSQPINSLSHNLHKPQSLSRSPACASKCLFLSIRPLDAQFIPFLARVLLFERSLHLV